MKKTHPAAFLLTCSLLTALGGCARDVASPCAAEEGGTVIRNVGEGDWSVADVMPVLDEVWRSPGMVGQPASVAAAPSGRLAVADWELGRIHVFSADGSSIGPWPVDAEVDAPVALAWDSRGGLHVLDLVASSILRTDPDGALVERRATSPRMLESARRLGGMRWAGLAADGTIYFQPLHDADLETGEDVGASSTAIWRLRPGDEGIDTVARAPVRLLGFSLFWNQAAPSWPHLRASTGKGGLLAIGGRDDRYRIEVFDADGLRLRTICREADPLPLTAEERGEVEREAVAAALREVPQPVRPAVHAGFFLGAEGQLWVQRDRPVVVDADKHTPIFGNPSGLYDVFDPAGRYLGEIRAPAAIRLIAAAGEVVWGLAESEADRAHIVSYRLRTEPR
jgi:hypothetical protein